MGKMKMGGTDRRGKADIALDRRMAGVSAKNILEKHLEEIKALSEQGEQKILACMAVEKAPEVHYNTVVKTRDLRLRKAFSMLSKNVLGKAEASSLSLVNKRMDIHSESTTYQLKELSLQLQGTEQKLVESMQKSHKISEELTQIKSELSKKPKEIQVLTEKVINNIETKIIEKTNVNKMVAAGLGLSMLLHALQFLINK